LHPDFNFKILFLMKKILFLFLIFVGLTSVGYAQAAGKGAAEKSSSSKKAHAQMRHFDKRKKDPNMKHNGTSYRRNRKSEYNVDGDGFGTATQGKKRKKRAN
jgi:hypothetical protein